MQGVYIALVHGQDVEEVLQGEEVDVAILGFQVDMETGFRTGACAVEGAGIAFEAVAELGDFGEGGRSGPEDSGDEFQAVRVP